MCDCNIKYQKDIGWVRQNTTLYYGVGCPKGTTCFDPLLYKAIVRSDMVETIEEQLQH